MTKAFFDFEFTGLHKDTTPISVGIVAANGKQFYAEYTDYDTTMVDDWIQTQVIDNLLFNGQNPFIQNLGAITFMKGTTAEIKKELHNWLKDFKHIEFWSDVIPYDGVLLNELIGVLGDVPGNVDYIYYDIATLFKMFGIDPDVSREAFIDRPIEGDKHNALYDAKVIEACYDKLYRNRDKYKLML
jgi:hypothetical protein